MRRSVPALSWLCLSAVATLSTLLLSGMGSKAWAQFGPGGGMRPMGGGAGGMGGPGGMGGGPPGDKPEGPAEAAPGQAAVDIATESLPDWPQKKDRAFQPFTLNGYLRGRGFYWHNFNLGHFNDPTKLANPFGAPYSEIPDAMGAPGAASCAVRSGAADCREGRHPHRRHALPAGADAAHLGVRAGQGPDRHLRQPDPGLDARGLLHQRSRRRGRRLSDALQPRPGRRRVGHQRHPVVDSRQARLGRDQDLAGRDRVWPHALYARGTGMLFHDGNCPDCDFGTTVDRVMLTASAFDHFASISWDWAASGPTSAIVRNQMLTGWNYNIDNVDDVMQWTLLLGQGRRAGHRRSPAARQSGCELWRAGLGSRAGLGPDL